MVAVQRPRWKWLRGNKNVSVRVVFITDASVLFSDVIIVTGLFPLAASKLGAPPLAICLMGIIDNDYPLDNAVN
jgi:hypothetical protein|tara:strand:- start:571 stop:792 length:222 start_codon:yes stop_codon:yes gene_type:complete